MVIYSGFSSRKVEDRYNSLLKDMLTTLSQIIICCLDYNRIQSFRQSYLRIRNEIARLDAQKYSDFKVSVELHLLTQHFQQSDDGQERQLEADGPDVQPVISRYQRSDNYWPRTESGEEGSVPYESRSLTSNSRVVNRQHRTQIRVLSSQKKARVNQVMQRSHEQKTLQARQQAKTMIVASNGQTYGKNLSMKFNIREQDKKKRPRLDSGQIGTEHEPTMEELMRMNPFIQMRMRAFRQRKFAKEHMNSAIKEEDQDGEERVE